MSETTESDAQSSTASAPAKKRPGGLNGMLLADLKSMAGGLGVRGAGTMKKAQLVEAIKAAQSGGQSTSQSTTKSTTQSSNRSGARTPERRDEPQPDQPAPARADRADDRANDRDDDRANDRAKDQADDGGRQRSSNQGGGHDPGNNQAGNNQSGNNQAGNNQSGNNQGGTQGQAGAGGDGSEGDADASEGEGEGGSRRNRRRRGRDRNRAGDGAQAGNQGGQANQGSQSGGQGNQGGNQGNQAGSSGQGGQRGARGEPDTTILEDDVLVPAAGILDVLDNYAFVRTGGYLPGPDDVYLSLSMVRKFGLRRGDALVGQVRQPREGERKEKFNPMVRIDSVNGADPETARTRAEFTALTPVHPSQRMRLETAPDDQVGRVIDLAAPLGKGQRSLIVSPARAGKTSVLRAMAASVTRNHPECHLMVVLVDERPEEVTDFLRSVKGEVVASTFDRPPADHTVVAELAIERAKRLVELGHDVVVLMDGLTRLGRAYQASVAGAGPRTGNGGLEGGAVFPVKRFFGAARKLEEGGSLTILATVTVDSGSPLDELIREELSDTANSEVRLRRDLAEQGVVPPVDLVRSGTRAVDRLLSREESGLLDKLRRVLAGMDDVEAAELLLERVRGSQTNVELLTRLQHTARNVV